MADKKELNINGAQYSAKKQGHQRCHLHYQHDNPLWMTQSILLWWLRTMYPHLDSLITLKILWIMVQMVVSQEKTVVSLKQQIISSMLRVLITTWWKSALLLWQVVLLTPTEDQSSSLWTSMLLQVRVPWFIHYPRWNGTMLRLITSLSRLVVHNALLHLMVLL